MSTTTEKLALFKYDPSTDGAQTFNIKQAMNDNWDKIDDAVKDIDTTLQNKISKDSGTIGRIDASVLDDYKESGVWNFEVNADNPFGVGAGVLFTLVVHASKFNGVNPSVMQTAIGTHSNGSGKMFKRSYYAARGWTDWERLATATDLDTKVSKSGDTMTGNLSISANYAALILRDADGSNNPIGDFEHYNGISKIGSIQNDRSRELHIRSDSVRPNIADAMALYDSGSDSWYNILHTGNKPSGSYTGNGSEAARTINTGGIGRYCFIGDAYGFGFAIASGNGIACINIYNGNISYIRASDGSYFKDGILHVATSSELLNKSGYIFDYQVL